MVVRGGAGVARGWRGGGAGLAQRQHRISRSAREVAERTRAAGSTGSTGSTGSAGSPLVLSQWCSAWTASDGIGGRRGGVSGGRCWSPIGVRATVSPGTSACRAKAEALSDLARQERFPPTSGVWRAGWRGTLRTGRLVNSGSYWPPRRLW